MDRMLEAIASHVIDTAMAIHLEIGPGLCKSSPERGGGSA
jgi:hypothetical protein